jgi:hypothetical protein
VSGCDALGTFLQLSLSLLLVRVMTRHLLTLSCMCLAILQPASLPTSPQPRLLRHVV